MPLVLIPDKVCYSNYWWLILTLCIIFRNNSTGTIASTIKNLTSSLDECTVCWNATRRSCAMWVRTNRNRNLPRRRCQLWSSSVSISTSVWLSNVSRVHWIAIFDSTAPHSVTPIPTLAHEDRSWSSNPCPDRSRWIRPTAKSWSMPHCTILTDCCRTLRIL